MTYTPKPDWVLALLEELLQKEIDRLDESDNPTDIECEVDTEKLEKAYTKSKETKTYKEDKDE